MKNNKDKKTEYWVETWKKAGIALESIKKNELLSFNYNENLEIIDQMLQWAVEHQNIKLTSGLVEQQYYFMKLKT